MRELRQWQGPMIIDVGGLPNELDNFPEGEKSRASVFREVWGRNRILAGDLKC